MELSGPHPCPPEDGGELLTSLASRDILPSLQEIWKVEVMQRSLVPAGTAAHLSWPAVGSFGLKVGVGECGMDQVLHVAS